MESSRNRNRNIIPGVILRLSDDVVLAAPGYLLQRCPGLAAELPPAVCGVDHLPWVTLGPGCARTKRAWSEVVHAAFCKRSPNYAQFNVFFYDLNILIVFHQALINHYCRDIQF